MFKSVWGLEGQQEGQFVSGGESRLRDEAVICEQPKDFESILCHGNEFDFYLNCDRKPLKTLKHGGDLISISKPSIC